MAPIRSFSCDSTRPSSPTINSRASRTRRSFRSSTRAQTWAFNPRLQERLKKAVQQIDIPVLLIMPPRDANLDPGRVLGAEATRIGKKQFRTKIYPPTMPDSQQTHCFGGAKGFHNWAKDAVDFFNGALK